MSISRAKRLIIHVWCILLIDVQELPEYDQDRPKHVMSFDMLCVEKNIILILVHLVVLMCEFCIIVLLSGPSKRTQVVLLHIDPAKSIL